MHVSIHVQASVHVCLLLSQNSRHDLQLALLSRTFFNALRRLEMDEIGRWHQLGGLNSKPRHRCTSLLTFSKCGANFFAFTALPQFRHWSCGAGVAPSGLNGGAVFSWLLVICCTRCESCRNEETLCPCSNSPIHMTLCMSRQISVHSSAKRPWNSTISGALMTAFSTPVSANSRISA